jgi:hypothetical protein
MASKKEQKAALFRALETWSEVFEAFKEVNPDDAEFRAALQELDDVSGTVLQAYRAYAVKPVEQLPDFGYYKVELQGKPIERARCKNCGSEVDPRGAGRHHKSPACTRERDRRLGKPAVPAAPT